MKNKLSDEQIATLKSRFGDDKVSTYLEVARTVESDELTPEPTKEQTDKIASNMIV
jgi:hypothetical protein